MAPCVVCLNFYYCDLITFEWGELDVIYFDRKIQIES